MLNINIPLHKIQDPILKDAFQKVKEFIEKDALNVAQFKHFEISVDNAVTDFEFPHRLGFQPLDVIETSLIGGAIIWKYELFTPEKVVFSTDDAMTVRAFIGRFS